MTWTRPKVANSVTFNPGLLDSSHIALSWALIFMLLAAILKARVFEKYFVRFSLSARLTCETKIPKVKTMNKTKQSLLALTAGLFLTTNVSAVEPDWKPYADLLSSVVKQGTKQDVSLAMVDYATLKENGKINAVYQKLSVYPVSKLQGKQEKLAFYINIYNVLALKMVVDNWPLTSIKDVGSLLSPVWSREAGIIDGKTISLDDIENKVLRPMAEPRIHLAIVCASVSCPDLRTEAYTPERLEAQLDDQMKTFLANKGKGMKIDASKVYLSSIFKWFEEDFGGVLRFITHYVSPSEQKILDEGKLKISYLDYNWDLNGL